MFLKSGETIRNVAAAVVVACGLVTCAGHRPGAGYTDVVPREIRRLIAKEHGEGLHAVGSAVAPREGLAVRIAALEARAELARRFRAQVDALQKSYEELVNRRDAREYQETIEILASLELSGSEIAKSMVRRRKRSYTAKVLVVVSAQQLKKLVDKETQAYTSFRASKAYQALEERVRRERELLER